MYGIFVSYDGEQEIFDVHQIAGAEIESFDEFLQESGVGSPIDWHGVRDTLALISVEGHHESEKDAVIEYVEQMCTEGPLDVIYVELDSGATGMWMVFDCDPVHPIEPDAVVHFLN